MKNGANSELTVVTVEVELDDSVRLEVANELGELVRDIEERQKAFQLATAHHKGLISTLKSRQATLLEILASNKQEQNIECRPDYCYAEGTVKLIDVETGDIVEERQMTDEERQMNIMTYPAENKQEKKLHGSSGGNEETDHSTQD